MSTQLKSILNDNLKCPIYCIVTSLDEATKMAEQLGRLGITDNLVQFYEELPVPEDYTIHLDPNSYDEKELRTLYNHLQILDLAFNEDNVDRAIFCTGSLQLSRMFVEKFNNLEERPCTVLGFNSFRPEVWQWLQKTYLLDPHHQDKLAIHPEVVRGVQIYAIDSKYGKYLVERYKKPFFNYTGPKNIDLLTLYSGKLGGQIIIPPLALTPNLKGEEVLASRTDYF